MNHEEAQDEVQENLTEGWGRKEDFHSENDDDWSDDEDDWGVQSTNTWSSAQHESESDF